MRVNLVFERRGDLYLELIAPSGTISPLTRQRTMDNIFGDKNLTNWHITTLFSWGEDPKGQWKLRIENLDQNYSTAGELDLLQVDLLASGASLFWPRSGRPRATTSQEVDLSRLKGLHLQFVPKMGSGVTRIWGFRFQLRVLDFNSRMC